MPGSPPIESDELRAARAESVRAPRVNGVGFVTLPEIGNRWTQRRTVVSLGEAWPTCMWAPEAEPGMAPHAAMKGIPAARR